MTNPAQTAQEPIEKIAEEHRMLEDFLVRLERTTDPNVLLPRLDKLRGLLEHHFATEEAADGVREDFTRNTPYLLEPLERIFEEHQEFLADVDALRAKTRELVDGPLAELRSDLSALARRLHDHEIRETEFFVEAVSTDLGEGS